MLKINDELFIDESVITFQFIHSSGPGGQNVNKVATAVQLRYDLNDCDLPEAVKQRLYKIAKGRISEANILIIEAKRFRTQERNKQDAVSRLTDLIAKALYKPKPRKKSKPTKSSIEKRLESKKKRSALKKQRGAIKI